ncbi:MAG: pyridoxamine 5'-phosphate oxidase family protein [Lachnospiraceae bacterium]|nr:pyridoxamine 5'-phosphate oxidase family protein [Lachnospiraceae bacterium]
MTLNEIDNLVKEAGFASIGFLDEDGNPSIRRVFCTWHKGVGNHLISTNTSSQHVQAILKNNRTCLYFDNCQTFQGVCFTGTVIVHFDYEHKALIWNDGDEIYYPKGVDDEDYCVLEFQADHGRYYSYDGIGDISANEIAEYDKETEFVNYAKK